MDWSILSNVVWTCCEAYNDATLTGYYLFDSNGIYLDYNMRCIHDIEFDIRIVCQTIAFVSSRSYCFPTTYICDFSLI